MSEILIWTDIETTGLDETRDLILEIGMQATDWQLHPLDSGIHLVVRPSLWWWKRRRMSPFARQMHMSNKLVDEVNAGGTCGQIVAASRVIQYIDEHSGNGMSLLAGSSVDFDRRFLKQLRFLGHGALDGVSHRIVDVSVLDEIAKNLYPSIYALRPGKTTNHRVSNCLTDSMNLYRYYQHHLLPTVREQS
jgi:oligoribonuclease